ncbi:beta-ketoacyl-ACP synthase III [Stomatobaculum longum]|uniref:beta-ketoacyl-ACP synthase III n=1 Tax=Stomatobaculum longum TaxID=796942 RepID=UPI0028DC6D63|nr:beta-ketoacyl-ACP synthase III [Stomatobaculum longum]
MRLWISGTGSALPKKIVTNDDLAKVIDTSDEWIFARTGIHQRHVADETETIEKLGAAAAEKALEMAGVSAEEIGLIIFGTCTDGNVTPSAACQVQALIGAVNAVAFDINAACSGFLYSLRTAEGLLKTGLAKKALVIGGDLVTRYLDWQDRTTCVLFGDAVGAVVLDTTEDESKGDILGSALGADGVKGHNLTGRTDPDDHFLSMNGQEVFRFAVRTVPLCIEEALRNAGVDKKDVSAYVLHQANSRIIEAVAKYLGEPLDKFPMNLSDTANTSAGSIPTLFDRLNREGRFKRGDILVLSGFGGGLTWGATVIRY